MVLNNDDEAEMSTQRPEAVPLNHPSSSTCKKEEKGKNVPVENKHVLEERVEVQAHGQKHSLVEGEVDKKTGEEVDEPKRPKKKRKKQSYKDMMANLRVRNTNPWT